MLIAKSGRCATGRRQAPTGLLVFIAQLAQLAQLDKLEKTAARV